MSLIILLLALLFQNSNIIYGQASPANQQTLDLSRTAEVVGAVQVTRAVRVRSEPGTAGRSGTVIRTAEVGEEFRVRENVDWVEANDYTWIPVTVDGQDAWIAQEGFVRTITEEVQVAVTQAEIDAAYTADLPEDAVDIVAENNSLLAVDADDNLVATWDWGEEPGSGHWVIFDLSEYQLVVDLPLGDIAVNMESRALQSVGGIEANLREDSYPYPEYQYLHVLVPLDWSPELIEDVEGYEGELATTRLNTLVDHHLEDVEVVVTRNESRYCSPTFAEDRFFVNDASDPAGKRLVSRAVLLDEVLQPGTSIIIVHGLDPTDRAVYTASCPGLLSLIEEQRAINPSLIIYKPQDAG